IGVGSIRIMESDPNKKVKIMIEFQEPYKNTGFAEFTFREDNGKTKVTWTMNGKSPYPIKVLRSAPKGLDLTLGTMFELGLKDMKEAAESKRLDNNDKKDDEKKDDEPKEIEKKKGPGKKGKGGIDANP